MNQFSVGNLRVGPDHPVLVIAEIGINHNASLETALEMISVAAGCGADAVKFQKREPEVSVPQEQRSVLRQTPWGEMTYFEYRQRMEFTFGQYEVLKEEANKLGLEFFASPWDIPSLAFLLELEVPVVKIASACLTDDELLMAVSESDMPVILSTGMSTMGQVSRAVDLLDRNPLAIAHSTSSYPCPPEELNLRMIPELRRVFDRPIGYSGHEIGIPTSVAAVALGAEFVERHFTLDRTQWGSDQAASLEPHGLEKLVRHIRVLEIALGDGVKRVYSTEEGPMRRLRRFP